MNGIAEKQRSDHLLLEGVDAAIQRLSPGHPLLPALDAKHRSIIAGIAGEERVAATLRNHSFLYEQRTLHDLSLSSTSRFQMDSLFLTNFWGVLFEVKNIAGRLKFMDDPPQLIRTRDNGEVDGFDCPAAQMRRNCQLIGDWLRTRNMNYPIYGVVVLAYSKQIVEKPPANTKILFPPLIPSYLNSIPRKNKRLENGTLDWLSNELILHHEIYIPDPICETYNIPKADIRRGVLCEKCGRNMTRILRTWECKHCGITNRQAHEKAIKDWFLLFGGKMTNRDCREFLGVDRHTAYRFLQHMDLKSEGTYKDKAYYMDFKN